MIMEDSAFELHPWAPFIDKNTEILIMGTFPPPRARWSMDFYYPNRSNDFWRIMGLIFLGDQSSLLIPGTKDFDVEKIKKLMSE